MTLKQWGKDWQQSSWAGVLLWTAIALGLRLANLTLKPIWADEFSTLVFGLGQSYQVIPLDQVIDAATLLAPAIQGTTPQARSVVTHLMTESNHPPLYFLLTYGWFQLWQPTVGAVTDGLLWTVRSLSVLCGTLTIPAMFGLGWVWTRSRTVAHTAALLMAVSPFGIYLAQEARHYTLAVFWEILALACCQRAIAALNQRQRLSPWLILTWIVIHGLGMATHYFFSLVILAEAIVLVGWWLGRSRRSTWERSRRSVGAQSSAASPPSKTVINAVGVPTESPQAMMYWWAPPWWSLVGLALGSAATCAVWLPFLRGIHDSDLTWWLYRQEGRLGLEVFQPVLETIAGISTMFYLLPIQAVASSRAEILYGAVLALATLLTVIVVGVRLRSRGSGSTTRTAIQFGLAYIGAAILCLWVPTYLLGMNLTYGFRYNFVYFPMVMLLVAIALSPPPKSRRASLPNPPNQPSPPPEPSSNWTAPLRRWGLVAIVAGFSLVGSLVVITDGAYQKTHRPDQVVDTILDYSTDTTVPVLIAMSHQTHGQTGRLMAIAWELARRADPSPLSATYILDHEPCDSKRDLSCKVPTDKLRQTLLQMPRPVDLWLVNYHSNADLTAAACAPVLPEKTQRVDGYQFYRYHCP